MLMDKCGWLLQNVKPLYIEGLYVKECLIQASASLPHAAGDQLCLEFYHFSLTEVGAYH